MPPDLLSIPAEPLLRRYGLVSLQQMGRQRGIDIRGKAKGVLVPLLARKLYEPATVAAALESLEPVERYALDQIILMGGSMPTSALRNRLEAEGRVEPRAINHRSHSTPEGSVTRPGSNKFEDIVGRLGVLGLVFTTDLSTSQHQNFEFRTANRYLYIPHGILRHLPPVTLPVETANAPPVEKTSGPEVFLRDMYVLLSSAQDEPIPLTVRGQISKRVLVRIDESLRVPEGAAGVRSESELGRLPLLRTLAEDLALLIPGAGGLRLTDTVESFLSRPRGERQRQLYEAYCRTKSWSELVRLRDMTITPRNMMYGPGVTAARRRVLQEIAELPGGKWITIAHLVERLRQRAYEFLVARTWVYSRFYLGSLYYEGNPYQGDNPLQLSFGGVMDEKTGWDRVEAGFIRVMVTEVLYWLGMVDLGAPDESSEFSHFRLTAEGVMVLRGETPESPTLNPNVVIQPNFQIFAFEPTGEDVLFTLDRIARRVRSEQVVEYQLTRESVYAAQRRGMESEAILPFLERISSAPLPQNVRRSLEDWSAQLERIVVRRGASLVHAADEQTLDTLFADSETGSLLGRRIGPTVALVPAQNLETLYTRLVQGFTLLRQPLPAISEGDDAWQGGTIDLDPTGRIVFRQRLPSIHLLRALRPFADGVLESESGQPAYMQLTPGSLRRGASKQGRTGAPLTAEEMIAVLERAHAGPLPEEIPAMVRRWAKNWGKGALAEVALLQVESPQIMADLMADPDLKRLLHPLPAAPTLATVRHASAEQVRALLKERGMDLQEGFFSR